jgi:peptide-methionine (S)-S-oxide reductase
MREYWISGLFAVLVAGTTAADDAGAGDPRAVATFAGGCFWCLEGPFDDIDGVKSTTSGYTGGSEKNPTYEQVSGKQTGHCEALRVEYDPEQVTYAQLLEVYWHNIDPTAGDHQFCDWGPQYRPEIFYHDEEQRALAEASRRRVEEKFRTVAVKITPAGEFWPAEDYHQDFYLNNADYYSKYRRGCGRDKRLEELWGKDAGH